MRVRNSRKGKPRPEKLLPAPAPGRLKIIQDFVNTRDDDSVRDELPTPQALGKWLADRRLLPAKSLPNEAEWQSALEVREGLRALLRAHGGLPVDPQALERLNHAIHGSHPFMTLEPEGRVVLESAVSSNWAGVVALFAEITVEAIGEGHWKRLKICLSNKCQWAFYDSSKNLSGKWCNKRRCGNRAVTKAYRRRGPRYLRGPW